MLRCLTVRNGLPVATKRRLTHDRMAHSCGKLRGGRGGLVMSAYRVTLIAFLSLSAAAACTSRVLPAIDAHAGDATPFRIHATGVADATVQQVESDLAWAETRISRSLRNVPRYGFRSPVSASRAVLGRAAQGMGHPGHAIAGTGPRRRPCSTCRRLVRTVSLRCDRLDGCLRRQPLWATDAAGAPHVGVHNRHPRDAWKHGVQFSPTVAGLGKADAGRRRYMTGDSITRPRSATAPSCSPSSRVRTRRR
jgi:hypothetical protein